MRECSKKKKSYVLILLLVQMILSIFVTHRPQALKICDRKIEFQEKKMRLTTICYIEKDDSYLMLHRTKKQNDQSHDKWLGVGGKFEKDESPDECMLREVKEETGLTLESFRLRGV